MTLKFDDDHDDALNPRLVLCHDHDDALNPRLVLCPFGISSESFDCLVIRLIHVC